MDSLFFIIKHIEVQSNNEIEGILSTKRELKEVLSGLMKTYLFKDQIKMFTEIEDFRKLYDDLVSDEIDKEDAPDEFLDSILVV